MDWRIIMETVKQIGKRILIFFMLIAITFIVVFKSHNFSDTIKIITTVNYRFIILAMLAMFLDFLFESLNIRNVLMALDKKVTIKNALKYTLIGFFGSGITPAASGGQPMEIYFMKNDGIPVSKSTLALLIEICAFHIVTISSGIIGAIVNHNLIKDGFIWIFIIGISLNIIAASFLMLGLFSKKLSDWLVKIVIKLLTIFKYKKVAELEKKMLDVLDEYHKGANFIRKNKHIFIKSVIIVFFQVLMYYTVSYFVYRSFGLNNHSYFRIVSISAMLFISISSMPLPGTVGISEGAFLKIYLSIYGIKKLASAMLLNRGINFYLYMIISFVVVVIATLKLKRRTKEN